MWNDPALAPEKFINLRDQEPLTASDWAVAERTLAYIQDVCEHREARVGELKLDPAIWLPAANWDRSQPFYRNFRALFDRQNLPLLRIYSPQFTGYRLGWLGGTTDPVPGESVDAIQRRLEERQAKADTRIATYAMHTRTLPEAMHITPPRKFGEVGWMWRGKLVNHDTVAYLERLMVMHRAGLLDPEAPNSLLKLKRPRILEIGGGYGALAYYIKQIVPDARYTIVDLPESLAYSAIYLGAMYQQQDNHLGLASSLKASQPGFTFLPNHEFPGLIESGAEFDLVINTLSFSEMSLKQVRAYCRGISQAIGKHGVFYEQNQDNRHLGLLFAQEIVRPFFRHRLAMGIAPRHDEIMRSERGRLTRARYLLSKRLDKWLGRDPSPLMILEQGYANQWAHRPITVPSCFAARAA